MTVDTSDRMGAENALHASEQHFRSILESFPGGIFVSAIDDGEILYCNDVAARLVGLDKQSMRGRYVRDFYDDPGERQAIVERMTADGHFYDLPLTLRTVDGAVRTITMSGQLTDHFGRPGMLTAAIDITERVAMEEALRDSQKRFLDFAKAGSDRLWETDAELRYTWVNEPFGRRIYPVVESFIGQTRWQIFNADVDNDPHWRRHKADLDARRPFRNFEHSFANDDGTTIHWSVSGIPIFDRDGRFQGYRGTATDVTQSKEMEERLGLLGSAVRELHDRFLLFDAEDRFVICDNELQELFDSAQIPLEHGVSFEEFLRRMTSAGLVKDAIGREAEWIERRVARHRNPGEPFEVQRREDKWLLIREHRLPDGGMVTIGTDITRQKLVEMKLRESEARFSAIVDNIPGAVYRRVLHTDGSVTYPFQSPGVYHYLGIDPQEVVERPGVVIESIHPEDRSLYEETFVTSAALVEDVDLQFRRIVPSGEYHWFRTVARAHKRDNGEVVWDGVTFDITEQKRSDEALRQAQKMEALGDLAGGMAHNLNNLLLPILALSEMTLEELAGDSPAKRRMEKVVRASRSARDLVSRVLGFTRVGTTEHTWVDIRALVADTIDLLPTIIPSTVDTRVHLADHVGQIHADSTQIETVLMNLVINAADAIDGAGVVDIFLESYVVGDESNAANVDLEPGAYAKMTVRDDGTGMDEAILENIFEPFFTTKEEGQGTGLGLSTAHSIVDAHDGIITVSSKPGSGTTFSVFLPVTADLTAGKTKTEDARPASTATPPDDAKARKGAS